MPKHSKFCTKEEWKIDIDSGSLETAMAIINPAPSQQWAVEIGHESSYEIDIFKCYLGNITDSDDEHCAVWY